MVPGGAIEDLWNVFAITSVTTERKMGREVMRVNCEAVSPSPAEVARVEEAESLGMEEVSPAKLHRVSFERPFNASMLETTHLYRSDNSFFRAEFEDGYFRVVR